MNLIGFIIRLFAAVIIICTSVSSYALAPVTIAQQLQTINAAFPTATRISDKAAISKGNPEVRTIYQGKDVIGYAFETVDVVAIAAYSGKPVKLLVAIDLKGEIKVARVLDHHEPILLVGIPEQRLFDFVDQLLGAKVTDHVIVGRSANEGTI